MSAGRLPVKICDDDDVCICTFPLVWRKKRETVRQGLSQGKVFGNAMFVPAYFYSDILASNEETDSNC
jgi:hypothetical protein